MLLSIVSEQNELLEAQPHVDFNAIFKYVNIC